MKIQTKAFKNNQHIPVEFTCRGNGNLVPIEVVDVPKNTQSLAVLVKDPDAPNGEFIHWLIWNIDPETKVIEGQVQNAIEGNTSMGKPGWVPPCPPSGTHRYIFTLFALDKMLSIPESSKLRDFEESIEGHIIEEASLVGLFGSDQEK